MIKQTQSSPTQIQMEIKDCKGVLFDWIWLTSDISWALVEEFAPEPAKETQDLCNFDLASMEKAPSGKDQRHFLGILKAKAHGAIAKAKINMSARN